MMQLPIFYSQAEFKAPGGGTSGVNIHSGKLTLNVCEGSVDCRRPQLNEFEMISYAMSGRRLAQRESSQISVKLQKDTQQKTGFTNSDPVVPLFSSVTHFAVEGFALFSIWT